MLNAPSWFDWLTLLAIVAGPILALLTQRWLDVLREHRSKRERLYFTLMSSRAVWISDRHVEALNSIDVVFAEDTNICTLWKKVLEHAGTDKTTPGWADNFDTLRADLYQAIGNKLGYRYTTEYIKRGIYLPEQHLNIIVNQNRVLDGLASALDGGRLRVEVREQEASPDFYKPPPSRR